MGIKEGIIHNKTVPFNSKPYDWSGKKHEIVPIATDTILLGSVYVSWARIGTGLNREIKAAGGT